LYVVVAVTDYISTTFPSDETTKPISSLAADEDIRVLHVGPSTCTDTMGAVDATVLVGVGEQVVEAEVTLVPNPGRPTGRHGRQPLDTWGTAYDHWASDNLVHAVGTAEDADEDFDRVALAREIVAWVDEAAEGAGL
jgi:hypothetical protein